MTARKERATAGLAMVLVAVAATALVVQDPSQPDVGIRDIPGTAWFPSTELGAAVLVDSTTAEVVARVGRVAPRTEPFEVIQLGSSALTVGDDGSVRHVDGRTWQLSEPAEAVDAADVHVNGGHAWATPADVGEPAQFLDPHTPRLTGRPSALPDRIEDSALTSAGTAWLVDSAGTVWSARPGRAATPSLARARPGADVVTVADEPVVVGPDEEAEVLDPSSGEPVRRVDLAVEPGVVGGTDGDRHWVLVVDASGGLGVSDVTSGSSLPRLDLAPGSDTEWGTPVEHDGLVYVPRVESSTIAVANPERQEVDLVEIDAERPDPSFNVFVHDDEVWFDDPTGDTAGYFTEPTTPRVVSKAGHDQGPTTSTSTTTTSSTTTSTSSTSTTSTTGPPSSDQRPPDRPPSTPSSTFTTAPTDPAVPGTDPPDEPPATAPPDAAPPVTPLPGPPGPPDTQPPGPPPGSCGADEAAIQAPSPSGRQFNVIVTICQPAPLGYHDWVMNLLDPVTAGGPSTWWAKRALEACTPTTPGRFSCLVTLGEGAPPTVPRHFYVVRWPESLLPWVNTLHSHDEDGQASGNEALPDGHDIISAPSTSTMQ